MPTGTVLREGYDWDELQSTPLTGHTRCPQSYRAPTLSTTSQDVVSGVELSDHQPEADPARDLGAVNLSSYNKDDE